MCIVCIANNINRNLYMDLNTRIFPTTGYTRVLLFVFIRREQGGTGTGCLFQFTYCGYIFSKQLGIHFSINIISLCHLYPFGECKLPNGLILPHKRLFVKGILKSLCVNQGFA